MCTSKLAVWYLTAFVIGACGSEQRGQLADGGSPDAGSDGPSPDVPPPDAPPDAPPDPTPRPLERLDWRTTRGGPLTTSTITTSGELFALSENSFVTRACQNAPGCTFTWHDAAGAPGRQREHMASVTSSSLSPDGRQALLVAAEEVEVCDDGEVASQVVRGKLQLLDVADGAARFELPLRSNIWSAPAFTPLSDWFFAAPIDGKACIATATGLRSAAGPFQPPPGLAGMEFVQAVDAQRWLAFRGADLGLVDPATPGSFQFLGDDPSRFDVTRGWVHVYLGFADLAQDVLSIPPTGPMTQTVLRDEDWHPFGALGRWVRVCRILQPEGYRDCRVVDAQGAAAPVNFRATFAPDHPDDAVLLATGAVVFVGPTDDGSRAVQRIDLTTGHREILHRGAGTLRSLGDGAAALLVNDGSAWFIEAGYEELVAEQVSNVVSVPRLPLLSTRAAGRQDDLALLVRSPGAGASTLAILDVRTRRLATVTDDLFFTPPRGLPFSFTDGCGQPWTTRHGGSVLEGLSQVTPQRLFFVEQGAAPAIWVLPIDLSAPPRRLAELAGSPALCHAPLATADGRLGFAENLGDGTTTRITLSSEK